MNRLSISILLLGIPPLLSCGKGPVDGVKSGDTATNVGSDFGTLDGCQSMATWMERCGDESVDLNLIVEECNTEVARISQECNQSTADAYVLGLQQSYECLLELEYCGTEEDALLHPDALETCGALFTEQNAAYEECTQDEIIELGNETEPQIFEPVEIEYLPPPQLRNILILEDDDFFALELPFALTFFEEEVFVLTITSNGLVLVGNQNQDGCCYGLSIPQMDEFNGLIAMGWGDLIPNRSRPAMWDIVGESPNREVWVQYNNVPAISSRTDYVSSTMRWVENTEYIDLFIESINYSEAMTIGVESSDGMMAVVHPEHNAQSIQIARTALRYTVEVPQ